MKEQKNYRSHYCGQITKDDLSKHVKIAGWVENIRDHGGVIFVDVRDETGVIQTVSDDTEMFVSLKRESCITMEGTVIVRDDELVNPRLKTGDIELLVEKIEVIGECLANLPFEIMTSKEVNEEVRLKHRYLDLRNEKVHSNIVFRSQVIKFLRAKMESLGFLEIQTPILTASSPEGARDFIVPSRKFKGKFYALPQAPQQFKQLLMVSGFDKYFQIAPCFRDEDARSDRSPGEFYQLDFEMAFVTQDDVLNTAQEVIYDTFSKFSTKKIIYKDFPKITYKESMLKYGTDKPDLRNPLEIIDLTKQFQNTSFKPFRNTTVRGIVIHDLVKTNSWFNEIVEYATSIGMPGIGYIEVQKDMSFKGPIDKFLTEQERQSLIETAKLRADSVLFFIADKYRYNEFASKIRTKLAEKLELIDKNAFAFCYIVDFPMFEYDEDEDKYVFLHNPFSMPQGDIEYIKETPIEQILAYQYDLVCNGVELSSGAIRNHDITMMEELFKLAGYSKEELEKRFSSLYNAFKYGAPVHGGMAPGIERMLMLLKDEPNIREVIAFPLSSSGADLMVGAPGEVSELQLRETHIKLR